MSGLIKLGKEDVAENHSVQALPGGRRNAQRAAPAENAESAHRRGECVVFFLLYALKQSKVLSQCLHLRFDIIGVFLHGRVSKGPFKKGSASEEGLHGY